MFHAHDVDGDVALADVDLVRMQRRAFGVAPAPGELDGLKRTCADGVTNGAGVVALDGDLVVVGSEEADTQSANPTFNLGAAYVFANVAGPGVAPKWVELKRLTAPDGGQDDLFACSVGASDDAVLCGMFRDDDLGTDAGAAYVFEGCRPLGASGRAVSELGGSVDFALSAGPSNAGRSYALLGGISGARRPTLVRQPPRARLSACLGRLPRAVHPLHSERRALLGRHPHRRQARQQLGRLHARNHGFRAARMFRSAWAGMRATRLWAAVEVARGALAPGGPPGRWGRRGRRVSIGARALASMLSESSGSALELSVLNHAATCCRVRARASSRGVRCCASCRPWQYAANMSSEMASAPAGRAGKGCKGLA